MGVDLVKIPPQADDMRYWFGVCDDFTGHIDGSSNNACPWKVVNTDNGSVTILDAAGGIARVNPSNATEALNDECYIRTQHEVFKFATDKPLVFEARVRPRASGGITCASYLVGLLDAIAANSLQDNAAGPDASYSGACFYTTNATGYWQAESSIAGTQTTINTGVLAVNATFQTLRIEAQPVTSTTTEIKFFIDDVQVGKKTAGKQFINQTVTHTSATEMCAGVGIKSAVASVTGSIDVDWIYCYQRR